MPNERALELACDVLTAFLGQTETKGIVDARNGARAGEWLGDAFVALAKRIDAGCAELFEEDDETEGLDEEGE